MKADGALAADILAGDDLPAFDFEITTPRRPSTEPVLDHRVE
jgi:hypothetical protein